MGRRIDARLREMEIHSVQDLMNAAPSAMRLHFGVVLERTCFELRGVSCLALEEVAPARKEIVSSRSFGQLVVAFEELAEAVSSYVARASEKLRSQESVCGAIHVFVQTNPFRQQDQQYCNGYTVPFAEATDDSRELAGAAIHGLGKIYKAGFQYKKAGVMLLDLSSKSIGQAVLFEGAKFKESSPNAMAALDSLNRRFGRDTVHLASAGTGHRWAMRAENRTPRYITSWNELPVVRAN